MDLKNITKKQKIIITIQVGLLIVVIGLIFTAINQQNQSNFAVEETALSPIDTNQIQKERYDDTDYSSTFIENETNNEIRPEIDPPLSFSKIEEGADTIENSLLVSLPGNAEVEVTDFWIEFREDCSANRISRNEKTDYGIGEFVEISNIQELEKNIYQVNYTIDTSQISEDGVYWFGIELISKSINNIDENILSQHFIQKGEEIQHRCLNVPEPTPQ